MIGTMLAHYRITAAIGAGGMGEVYRARDTKLDRDVAIKVLPAELATDPERLARFEREAKLLASLNHPNIAHVYGFESATLGDGSAAHFLAMELVEGEDLAERLKRGAVPVDEAIPLAIQIAEGLEEAHEHGIIHRDLKPANVKVTPDGKVKVLDFGLAKALEATPADAGSGRVAESVEASHSPTMSRHMTEAGMIMGTAAYMSPEQARGKPVDKRADIWSYGVVLFEMLTGTRAFHGEDAAEVLSLVLQREPDLTKLPRETPLGLQMLVARCLVKDPRQRLRDMGDARLALQGTVETAAPPTKATSSAAMKGGRLPWTIASVVALVATALFVPSLRRLGEAPPTSSPEMRVDIVTPATDRPVDFALSPDGRQIVFVATGDGASRLWLRSLATTLAQPLLGTEGGYGPFWSPDGRSMGFFSGNALKRLDLDGGGPRVLAPDISGTGTNSGTWGAGGAIVLGTGTTSPLRRVSSSGGSVEILTKLTDQQVGHLAPYFLPGGRQLLFFVRSLGNAEPTAIYLGALDGSAPRRITAAETAGVYLPSLPQHADVAGEFGWLLWVRAGTRMLVAQRLNTATATLSGEPTTLADDLTSDDRHSFRSAVSVTASGLIAYRAGGGSSPRLTWFDRSGAARGTLGIPDATLLTPRVSPDGRRVAVGRTLQGNADIWLLQGDLSSRFTFDEAGDSAAVWSPDGTRIAFRSTRAGRNEFHSKPTSGAGVEERLWGSERGMNPSSWSADGRFLLFHLFDPQTTADLWALPMVGDRTPFPVLQTPFLEVWGAFSPDGRWVAYQSNESGRHEIYVRPFVPPSQDGSAATATAAASQASTGPWQVSTDGGILPVWRRDGKELYFVNPAGAMMAAPISVTRTGIEPAAPVMLFSTRIYGGGEDSTGGRQYDVAPDGRFLINSVVHAALSPITLIQNWDAHP